MSEKTLLLAEALLDPRNRTIADAAQAVGLSEKQAYRIRQSREFQQFLERAQSEVLDALTARLLGALPHAEALFLHTIHNTEAHLSSRLRAAEGLVNLSLRMYEARSLDRRLSALEMAVGGGNEDI